MTSPYPGPGHPQQGPSFGSTPSFEKSPAPGYGGRPGHGPQGYGQVPPGPVGMPPGWYPGPHGPQQWWDGHQWGPPAPPQNDNSGLLSVFCHLGLFLSFLVPLIILLTEGKKNRFVKHHATEALNAQITLMMGLLVIFVLYIVGLVTALGGGATSNNAGIAFGGFFAVVIIFFVAYFAVYIGAVVCAIIGAVQAGQRKYWRYPVAVRFVRGAATREEIARLNTAGQV